MKETRKTESDSKSGMKKMAIGHHIGKTVRWCMQLDKSNAVTLVNHGQISIIIGPLRGAGKRSQAQNRLFGHFGIESIAYCSGLS